METTSANRRWLSFLEMFMKQGERNYQDVEKKHLRLLFFRLRLRNRPIPPIWKGKSCLTRCMIVTCLRLFHSYRNLVLIFPFIGVNDVSEKALRFCMPIWKLATNSKMNETNDLITAREMPLLLASYFYHKLATPNPNCKSVRAHVRIHPFIVNKIFFSKRKCFGNLEFCCSP